MKKKIVIIIGLISAAFLATGIWGLANRRISPVQPSGPQIAVIGGSDGPTAIYLTAGAPSGFALGLMGILLALGIIGAWIVISFLFIKSKGDRE